MPTILSASYHQHMLKSSPTKTLCNAISSMTNENVKHLGYDILNLTQGSTFTRTTSGSYYNGSSSSIEVVNPNILRVEDIGDVFGQNVLMEGVRTNRILDNENPNSANWTRAAVTFSGSQNNLISPSNTATAEWLQQSSLAITSRVSQTVTAGSWGNDVTGSFSTWLKISDASIATPYVNFYHIDRAQVTEGTILTASNTWKRFDRTRSAMSGVAAANSQLGTNLTMSLGTTWSQWGYQLESVSAFPTSYISSANAATVRQTETLSFAAGTWPSYITSSATMFDCYPSFASTEGGGTDYNLLAVSASAGNSIRLQDVTGLYRIRIDRGGSTVATSHIFAFARNTKVTVAYDPRTGGVSVWTTTSDGIVSGTGNKISTPWAWPAAETNSLFVGCHSGATIPFFGRISNFRRAF